MTVALQIRDVPDDVRDVISKEAAARGQSMQAYLLELVQREAAIARNADMFERLAPLRVSLPPGSVEEIVREGRADPQLP